MPPIARGACCHRSYNRAMASRVTPLVRAHAGLLVVLVAGLALRVALFAGYQPAILSNPDSWSYLTGAQDELFVPDARRPAGYALLLRGLHGIWDRLEFVIAVQHLLGLVAVVLVYAIVLRAGAGRWAALVPAAVGALTLDLIALEHAPLSETTFMVLLLAAVLLLQVAMERADDSRWQRRGAAYAGAGLLLGTAVTVRTGAVFVLPVIVVLVAALTRQNLVRRAADAALVAAPAIAVIAVYVFAQHAQTGYTALNPGSGWMLYARAAPIADCRYFAEPKGSEGLCEASAPSTRPGGDFYAWDPRSPARNIGIAPLDADPLLSSWSRAAIVQEPKAYLREVARDLWRYVDPYPERRTSNGGTPDLLRIDARWEPAEELNGSVAGPYYSGGTAITTSGVVDTLTTWQRSLRFHGPLMLASLLLVVSGLAFARGQALRTMLVLAAVGFVVPVVSVLTVMWVWRYAVPLQPAMAGAAAIGAVATVRGLAGATWWRRSPGARLVQSRQRS